MRFRAACAAILATALISSQSAGTRAQTAGAPPQDRQAPTFQAGAQLVQVDVRVFDQAGRFVEDLTIDDFEVFDRGVRQAIGAAFFVGPAAGDPATAPPLVTLRGAATAAAGAATTPSSASARQTWIMVFDLNHLTPGAGFERAKAAVQQFLAETFRDGDLGGVVAGSRMVGNRLTSVRQELIDAAASVKAVADQRARMVELTREWPRVRDEAEALAIARDDRDALQRAAVRACSDDPSACRVTPPDLLLRDKARRFRTELQRSTSESLAAMAALGNGLARVPGPKTIVLLSDGFVIDELESALRGAVGQAARAGARIYAIDVRGLNRGGGNFLDAPAPDDRAGGPARFDLGADGPNSLAVDTGGLMIRNENNLVRALSRVADDASRYYILGYQPKDLVLDGQYRAIDVRVSRPGLTVRARKGYLALPASQLLIPQPIK